MEDVTEPWKGDCPLNRASRQTQRARRTPSERCLRDGGVYLLRAEGDGFGDVSVVAGASLSRVTGGFSSGRDARRNACVGDRPLRTRAFARLRFIGMTSSLR